MLFFGVILTKDLSCIGHPANPSNRQLTDEWFHWFGFREDPITFEAGQPIAAASVVDSVFVDANCLVKLMSTLKIKLATSPSLYEVFSTAKFMELRSNRSIYVGPLFDIELLYDTLAPHTERTVDPVLASFRCDYHPTQSNDVFDRSFTVELTGDDLNSFASLQNVEDYLNCVVEDSMSSVEKILNIAILAYQDGNPSTWCTYFPTTAFRDSYSSQDGQSFPFPSTPLVLVPCVRKTDAVVQFWTYIMLDLMHDDVNQQREFKDSVTKRWIVYVFYPFDESRLVQGHHIDHQRNLESFFRR